MINRTLRPCEGRVFPMDVEAVALNLLTNAYFFAKLANGERRIMVELRPQMHDDKRGFLLAVADSGPGVPRDRRADLGAALQHKN